MRDAPVPGAPGRDAAIRATDAHRIATMFAADGEMSNEGDAGVVGPIAIEKLLHGFDGKYVVTAQRSTIESVITSGEQSDQRGHYRQTVHVVESGQELTVCGNFEAIWVRTDDGWRLRKMHTQPHPC